MNKKLCIFMIVIFALLLNGCQKNEDIPKKEDIKDMEESEEEKIDSIKESMINMTMEEKIGQLLIVGIEGTAIEENTIELIEDYKVGGFILFSRNINDEHQTLELLNSLKKANSNNDIPLFLSIDEEGGRVSRLPKSFEKLPEAKKIGDINDKDFSFKYGKILGERVKSLGFNMDFAPVLDINSNPKNPTIGNRAFGSTIDVVVYNGLEVMEGIQSVGVVPSIKHFPGHGDTSIDSHLDLPIIDKNLNDLKEFELVPFKRAIDEGADMVMVGHMLLADVDADNPSSLSKKVITDVLRHDLKYDKVVITDDMTMGAIVKNYDIGEASLKSLKAGSDIVLICHGYENSKKVIDTLKKAVEDGDITEDEIDEKVYRILKVKDKYRLNDEKVKYANIEKINIETRKILDKYIK
ncbi:beta-N-acetylhexosaminidase [Sporanaerobacter acetigenes]|uniref:Beta-N-acetylhexosaminidase n=2 Tax=Sporanaerobacter acetigenes TaxID=165813 RepID=A0A1M5WKE7_9FIRM|nr:beta-N-acetylhexosaminidase [Sporanaerobacter acetigenes DSM 13106]